MKHKIIVILGPTATGKSDLAIRIAKKYNGEIISADSRQVYRGLNIGTGKVTKKEMCAVPHHLLDVANPRFKFSVTEFIKLAEKAIAQIVAKNKIPIICGGTGFYIQALVDGMSIPNVPINIKLRRMLSKMNVSEMFQSLLKLDPKRAETIDKNNPRRIIRAIEIATALGKVPLLCKDPSTSKYEPIYIGLKLPINELKNKISVRLLKRMKSGMLNEAKKLHTDGLSWKRMDELGLEYRYMARHLQGKISKDEMISLLTIEIYHYAKRQITWFKKNSKITWFLPNETVKIDNIIDKNVKC